MKKGGNNSAFYQETLQQHTMDNDVIKTKILILLTTISHFLKNNFK